MSTFFRQVAVVYCLVLLQSAIATRERVISEENAITTGVDLDYSYNETFTGNGFTSVPGCPKSDSGYPWIYYGQPPRCYLAGSKGPCEAEQKLFIEVGNPFGFCNCPCFGGKKRQGDKDAAQFCNDKGTTNVFIPTLKKCFTLYEQGPCNHDEWIVLVDNPNPNFVRTRCDSRTCPQGQQPDKNDGKKCIYRLAPHSSPASIPPHECEKYNKVYSKLLRTCVSKFNFDF